MLLRRRIYTANRLVAASLFATSGLFCFHSLVVFLDGLTKGGSGARKIGEGHFLCFNFFLVPK